MNSDEIAAVAMATTQTQPSVRWTVLPFRPSIRAIPTARAVLTAATWIWIWIGAAPAGRIRRVQPAAQMQDGRQHRRRAAALQPRPPPGSGPR
jgi:hypothetical protein